MLNPHQSEDGGNRIGARRFTRISLWKIRQIALPPSPIGSDLG